jgi:hypothetical protein
MIVVAAAHLFYNLLKWKHFDPWDIHLMLTFRQHSNFKKVPPPSSIFLPLSDSLGNYNFEIGLQQKHANAFYIIGEVRNEKNNYSKSAQELLESFSRVTKTFY